MLGGVNCHAVERALAQAPRHCQDRERGRPFCRFLLDVVSDQSLLIGDQFVARVQHFDAPEYALARFRAQPYPTQMEWNTNDWVEHPKFGVGQIIAVGDNLSIRFLKEGEKMLVKTAELKPANPPTPDFQWPKARSGSGKARVSRRAPADFDVLVGLFRAAFPGGFDDPQFESKERNAPQQASKEFSNRLAKESFAGLLAEQNYAEVANRAMASLQSTNLVFPMERIKFKSAVVGNPGHHERFSTALFQLLYGDGEEEPRFTAYCDALAAFGIPKWPLATYFWFLSSHGEQMFMKPLALQRMADAVAVPLEYRTEPNWMTYSKLRDLAAKVESELRSRGLSPQSRMDVQGFIWSALQMEDGKYGGSKKKKSAKQNEQAAAEPSQVTES